ncbi:SLC13 family permease [Helicobacter sp. 11S02629-2]|uniref:SLC13 family permease n=1 Tax=Helicobacter sp. 11S02629-2 TaxID=1476195 RepID=UPI000BA61A3E|nr:SLC13 family permease [Helicobacter sp. 11S02629-2]PAF46002.1 hypothetical protein BKH40_00910 [Helicobacter sp. 11S02629-2]
MEVIHIIIIGFIILSIILGYVFKTNIGAFAIPLAFIAAFYYGLKPSDIVNLWGLNLFFILISITFFYGFAISNGTLNLLAHKAIYSARNYAWSIPIVLYIVVVIFVAIGPGHYAGFAFMSPLVLYIANRIKMSKLLAAIIIYSGSCAGGFNPFTLGGRFVEGFLANTLHMESSLASTLTWQIGESMFYVHTLIFIIGYFAFKGYKVISTELDLPEKISAKQARTIGLVVLIFALVIIPSVWLAFDPSNLSLKKVTTILNPTFLCFLGVVLAIIFRVGDEKAAFKNIPWDLIIMVGGLGMLISIGVQAGAIKALGSFITDSGAQSGVISYLLAIASSAMSLFASSMGVVMPTFFPLVPTLSIGLPLGLSVVAVFATFTGYSPFSTGGALVLAGTKDEHEKKEVFIKLLFFPFFLVIGGFILLSIGFFSL